MNTCSISGSVVRLTLFPGDESVNWRRLDLAHQHVAADEIKASAISISCDGKYTLNQQLLGLTVAY